ncbi:MAG: NADH-quinone oxidoreductase subunit C [Anaerolineae bacterium]|nr:NADH-quinone oxidoreductase subunit C [Anaerolineae bacterium]
MEIENLLAALGEVCPDHSFETRTMPVDETVIEIPAACLEDVVDVLRRTFSVYHLSTITGQDRGTELELLYHFWHGQGITLQVTLPREDPCVSTLTGAIPGADFYEREVGEMLGVTFEGHPGPEHLLLPEDWESEPPLRKERPAEEGDT